MQQLTSTQKARLNYEAKHIKITVRLDPSLEPKLSFLTREYGSQNEAIAQAITKAYVGDRIREDRVKQLEDENAQLQDRIAQLNQELSAAKQGKYTQQEQDELLEIALEEWEKRRVGHDITSAIDHPFFDFEQAQSEII